MNVETVYAIHTFRAEHNDEINFQYGEAIKVLEKDEMYGDGWWQGQNVHGQIGLFPMNYTSYTKPSLRSSHNNPNTGDTNSDNIASDDIKKTETPTNTISDIQSKLHKLVLKNKSEAKLNIKNQSSDPNILKTKTSTPQTPIVHSHNKKDSDKNLSLTINNVEDLDGSMDFNNSNDLDNLNSPRPSSSLEEERIDNTNTVNSTSKISNHITNWRPSYSSHSSHPSTWNVEQVCQWLREKSLHSIINHFVENDITGDILIDLSLESLKELNIMSYGKRIHIMNAIKTLRDEYSLNNGKDDGYKTNKENAIYTNLEYSKSFPDAQMLSTINKSITDVPQKINDLPEKPQTIGRTLSKKGSKIFSKLAFLNKHDKGGRGDKISHSPSFRILSSPRRTPSNGGWDFSTEEEEMEKGLENKYRKKKKKDLKVITEDPNASSLNLDDNSESEYRNFYYEHPIEESINEEEDILSIDSPDYEGWLKKQGDKYKSWKNRYCILKGVNLFYLKSDKIKPNPQIKGRINLTGYRIVPDENILQGKYGLKLIHDSERAYYFAHDDAFKTKCWMKAMMKATISRDVKTPVITSSNMATMPLSEARKRIRSPVPFSEIDSPFKETYNFPSSPFKETYNFPSSPTTLRSVTPSSPISRSTSTSPMSTLNSSPHVSITQPLSFPSSIKQAPLFT